MKNEVYTVAQLADKLEVSERTISDAIRDGRLKGYKQFKRWYVTHDQLLIFLASNQEENKKASKRPNVNPNK
jgi:excisionase family DNA binding protein